MSARKRSCPTPGKQKYPDLGSARRALSRGKFNGLYGPTRAYKCRCGSYHLSSRA